MSVGLPPRVCEDTSSTSTHYDRRGECLSLQNADEIPVVVLTAYAHAIVSVHVPNAPGKMGDDLVTAYLANDPLLATLAVDVENAFDAHRAGKKAEAAKPKKPAPKKKKTGSDADAGVVVDGGAPVADAGAGSIVNAGTASGDTADAGAGVTLLHARLVGTWTSTDAALRNIYALCDDGAYSIRYELIDNAVVMGDELPITRGNWEAIEGDPPRLALTTDGETATLTLSNLTDDSVEVVWDEETLRLSRRSTSASCD